MIAVIRKNLLPSDYPVLKENIMSKSAIIAAGVVGAAALGGLGAKLVAGRKVQLTMTTPVATQYKQPEPTEPVVEPTPTPEPVAEEQAPVAKVPEDIVKHDPAIGMVSVSRMRVAEPKPEKVIATPLFWSNFVSNIRRPDVIELSWDDFNTRPQHLARGYHRAMLDGQSGVLHVTKGHISFVASYESLESDSAQGEFMGISSSASRFGGKGIQNLTAKQAKDFLNGR